MKFYKQLEAETGQSSNVFKSGSLYLAQTEKKMSSTTDAGGKSKSLWNELLLGLPSSGGRTSSFGKF